MDSLVLLLALAACETPSSAPPSDPTNTMKVAIGTEVREVSFGDVTCTQTDAVQTVELFWTRQTPEGRPRVLIARLRGSEVVDAHAFLPQVTFGEHDYDMLQLVADRVDGTSEPDCRVESESGLTLVCNETTVLPWLGTGERPRGSFKASFACP